MEIFPAIDIKGGQVVRLSQGDYSKAEIYSDDPLKAASIFKSAGAKNLHIVDLDGAKEGATINFAPIKKLAENSGLKIQVGGGIRDEERICRYLDMGIERVILGTAAINNFDFLTGMTKKYKDAIAVGVDAKDGKVAVNGWTEVTEVESLDFCRELEKIGVKTVIYTDISRDGMGAGTNIEIYRKLKSLTNLNIIASGGITHLWEIEELNRIEIYGAIVGKALYTGALNLEEVLYNAD